MDEPKIDWLLDCTPRPAQIEALQRSYTGFRVRDHQYDDACVRPLPHSGKPASGWGHMMQMRVGKTPTALNEIMLFKRDYGINRGFMLSPNKYKNTWGAEALKFGLDIPVHVFNSKNRKEFEQFMKDCGGEGFVIANYEALIYEDNNKLFDEWINDKTYMGADESVMLKNKDSRFFKNALKLSKSAAVTRPMTGLPTPQGPADIWSQLRFARKIEGFGYHPFKHTFSRMGGFRGKKVLGTKNEDRLDKLLTDCVFRAIRGDWATKIDSDFEKVSLPMLPVQKQHYKTMNNEFIAWLSEGDLVTAHMAMTKQMKLQQIASGFMYDEFKKVHFFTDFNKTPKTLDLIDRLENYISGKTIVVAHYTPTILALVEALYKFNPAMIVGDQHMKRANVDTEAEKTRFNGDKNCRVLIAQSQAVKYGHTLMGSKSDPCLSMCFFENNYSLDNRVQTEERPQGEGQQGPLHIWDYYSAPIEKKIISALQDKKDIADIIMGQR